MVICVVVNSGASPDGTMGPRIGVVTQVSHAFQAEIFMLGPVSSNQEPRLQCRGLRSQ